MLYKIGIISLLMGYCSSVYPNELTVNFYGKGADIMAIPFSPPPGYVRFENSYYKYHRDTKTFAQARYICEAEGGHLAIINSKDEADFIVGLINKHSDSFRYILVGFHDCFEEGVFVTIDGKSLETTGYTTWMANQPDNAGGKENCGSINRTGALNDFPCNLKTAYVCEISPSCTNVSYQFSLNGDVNDNHSIIDVRME